MSRTEHPRIATRPAKTIGVLIASYRRPEILAHCLEALKQQHFLPQEVLVVARTDDTATIEAATSGSATLPVRVLTLDVPGTVAARNAGLIACRSDVLAIIDDDTRPQPHWLARVLTRFAEDPSLGGLGGRDRCFDGTSFDEEQAEEVGKIRWYGRMVGNHHRGFGPLREVDFLKGANMSFRAEAFETIRFDTRLKGAGAQPREDTAFSIAIKAAGWKLAYDPEATVDHYAAVRSEARHYVEVKPLTDERSFREFAYNDVLALWLALSRPRRVAFSLWSVLVGTGVCPGLVQAVRFTPRLGRASWKRFFVAQQGKFAAFRDLLRS